MKRRIGIILAMIVVGTIAMSAQLTSHILQSRQFNEIYVKGNINVECRESVDSAGMIVFSATPEVFSVVNCNNVGTRLNIIVEGIATNVLRRSLSTIVVYYNGVMSVVSYTGSGQMRVNDAKWDKSVALLMTGAGRLRVDDVVTSRASCSVAGSGTISLAGISRINNVTCSVSGSGNMEFSHLDAHLASATVNGRGCLLVNGTAQKASFALKGSGVIDASSLNCEQMTAGAYGSGQIYYSHQVSQIMAQGNKDNIISR